MGLWEGGFGLNERSVELEVFAARERETGLLDFYIFGLE